MGDALAFTDFVTRVLGVGLTPAQAVLCRVAFDGIDPVDLPDDEREIARDLFGDVERVPAQARHVFAWLKGARVGGTWLCSLRLLHRALVADLSALAAGERGFAICVAPDVRVARQSLAYIKGAVESVPSISRLVIEQTRDTLALRRPDGRDVEIGVLPAARGGASTRGRSLVAVLLDESSFFRDENSAVNDVEVYRSVVVRALTGHSSVMIVSTAWTESQLLWSLIEENDGAPSSALAAVTPTLTMRPDDALLRQIVDDELRRDRLNARREFFCEPFQAGADHLINPAALRKLTNSERPMVLEPSPAPCAAAFDLAFSNDASACAIVRFEDGIYRLAEIVELRPPKGGSLKPSEVVAKFADVAKRHGVRAVWVDQFHLESVREHAKAHGLTLHVAPAGLPAKVVRWTAMRNACHEAKFEVAAGHTELLRQLADVIAKPTAGGQMSISQPRRRGSHGDQASAVVLALHACMAAAVYAPMDRVARKRAARNISRALSTRLDFGNTSRHGDEHYEYDDPRRRERGRTLVGVYDPAAQLARQAYPKHLHPTEKKR